MADIGSEKTDKLIDEMEVRLNEIYEQANKELKEKLDKYLERRAQKYDVMQKKYQDGKITLEEFEKWAKGDITGPHYSALLDTLATDLTNTNQIAMSIVGEYMPEAYAINHNYAMYQLDLGGVDVAGIFTLYDRNTVEKLIREDGSLLPLPKVDIPEDKRWNRQHIRNALTQGVLQGESIPKISKRLENVVGMDKRAAVRNARTAMTGAQNAGRVASYRDAKKAGVNVMQEWLATHDGRTRESHLLIEGDRVEIGEEFSNGCEYPGDPDGPPEEVYNCRCTLIPYLPDYDFDESEVSEEGFEEWQEEHESAKRGSEKKNTSVGNMKEPERPRKQDYQDEDKYYAARDAYGAERESFNADLQAIVNNTIEAGGFRTIDDVISWANERGVLISDEALNSISVNSFSAVRPALDEMFRRFPEVKSFTFESFDGSVYKTDFRIGIAKEGLLSANGGFNFNKAYFGNGASEYGIKDGLSGIMYGNLVYGDGSFSTLVRHEYGHNVQEYIEFKLADKYHYHTDDWRKHYGTFAEYDSARKAYFAERDQYNAELMRLAGLPGSSEYSNTNTFELFAEGFADWSSGNKSEFAVEFGKFLRRWY